MFGLENQVKFTSKKSIMKTQVNTFFSAKRSLILGLAVLLISACSKDDDNSPIIPDQKARIAWFHAATGLDSLHISIDENTAKESPIGYGDSTAYMEVLAGEHPLSIGTSDEETSLEDTLDFDENTSYSIFILGGEQGEGLSLVRVEDDLRKPDEENAKIRLAHLSPDAGTLQINVSDTVLAAETGFSNVSDFEELEAGSHSISIVDSDSEETIVELEDLELEAGKIYTIWLSGQVDATDPEQALQALIFENN